jgi:4-hydroxyacetophenone monooxygenase
MLSHAAADTAPAMDDAALRDALADAHLPTLLMVLFQLTGEATWLSDRYAPAAPRGGTDPEHGGFPPEVQHELRQAAYEAVTAWRQGKLRPIEPTPDLLHRMMRHSTADETIDPATVPMAAEELGLVDRDATWRFPRIPPTQALSVLIVGAGLSGLLMAIKLEEARIPYEIIERNDGVGGTWVDNRYPGAGVDSPSHLYEYSFEQFPDWPGYYSKREDIHAYFARISAKYSVDKKVRFRTHVETAIWDEDAAEWVIRINGPGGIELRRASVFISAVGLLNQPWIPVIQGIEDFAGTAMHSGTWDPNVDLSDKRIAVVGTGATAMQLVPSVADIAKKVTVFQRSPQWAIPVPDYKRSVSPRVRYLLAHVPFYAAWFRYRQFWNWNDKVYPGLQIDPNWPHADRSINEANDRTRAFLTRHITRTLEGRPDLIEKCVPTYPPYGKRILMDNGWFETLLRDDVKLVTEKIMRITPTGVVTADGVEHPADIIAWATGFNAHRLLFPMEIVGRRGVNLRQVWGDDDARAYLGLTVPDMPNFFCLFGPNTALGHGGSIVFHTELQVRYVMGMLRKMTDRSIVSVEVRRDVHDAYNASVDDEHTRMIWSHTGMTTWYRNTKGRVVSLSPWRLVDYWRMTREPDLADFHLLFHDGGL